MMSHTIFKVGHAAALWLPHRLGAACLQFTGLQKSLHILHVVASGYQGDVKLGASVLNVLSAVSRLPKSRELLLARGGQDCCVTDARLKPLHEKWGGQVCGRLCWRATV